MTVVAQFWCIPAAPRGFRTITGAGQQPVTMTAGKLRWVLSALVAALIGAALARVVPGRFGYWLDLGLVMFALYLCFCAVGSLLRGWVVSRSAPPA